MQFKFNLEKILSLVRVRETMKRMEVAAVVQRIAYLRNRKKTIEQNMRKTLELTRSGESPEWFAFYTSKLELDLAETRKMDHLLVEETDLLSRKQEELKEIMLKKKSLESLREKRFKDFRVEQNRRLQKQLDEIYQLTKQG